MSLRARERRPYLVARRGVAPLPSPPIPKEESAQRLVSLDIFRGLTIGGMLLVNNIALDQDTPAQLTHAPWNGGVTFADLIFPWFLLIVGVAVPFSAASALKKGLPLWRYDLKVLGRVVTLVLLGCLIDSSIAQKPLFDLDVLQLIGLAYGAGSLLAMLPISRRLAVAFGLLLIHWAAIKFVPVPGVGRGVFTEQGNLIAHLNQAYLQPIHLDGLISVVPATALVLIGTAVGDTLRDEARPALSRLGRVLLGGFALVVCGWIWNFSLPFNKPVWTASYILYTAGWGSLLLGVFYWIADVKKWRWWTLPFVVFGSNAIVAYVGPILIKMLILRQWTWAMPDGTRQPLETAMQTWCYAHFGHYRGGWTYTVAYILVVWLALWQLYRRKIFLRV